MIVRLLAVVLLACAGMSTGWAQVPSEASADRMAHWGKWAEHLGGTVNIYLVTPAGYEDAGTESCNWVDPGIEMLCVEIYTNGQREMRYSLGLDNRIRSVGLTAAGHVVWDRYDDGTFGANYIADDGMPWTMRTLYQGDGQLTAWLTGGTREAVLVGLRDAPGGLTPAAIAKAADAARGMQKPAGRIVGSVAARASAPLVHATQAATMQAAWGPLSVLAGQDWVNHYIGWEVRRPTRFTWVEPGRVLQAVNQEGTAIYRLAPDGTIVHTPGEAEKDRSERTLYPQDDGALMEYVPPHLEVVQYIEADDKRTRYFTYLEPNGQVSKWMYSPDRPDVGIASSVYIRADGSTGPAPELLGATLRNPAAWGPLAALANMTVTRHGTPALAFRVAPGGEVMHVVRMGIDKVAPEMSLAVTPRGTIARRNYSTHLGRDIGSHKEGYIVDATTIEWRSPGRAMDAFMIDHIWSVVKGRYDIDFTTRLPESDFAMEYKVEFLRFDPESLAPALAHLAGTSRGLVAQVQAKADEYRARTGSGPYNKFAQVANAVLDAGMAAYEATVPPPTYGPPVAGSAGVGAGGYGNAAAAAPQAPSGTAGAPVTVFLWKGFQVPITPGATSNEGCYAKVQLGPVTTDPVKRAGEAKRAVASAEQQFLADCRALGALGSGDFADEWSIDEKAESSYTAMRGNRWMHEVSVR